MVKKRITIADAYSKLDRYLTKWRWQSLENQDLKILYDIKNRFATVLKQTHWQSTDPYFFSIGFTQKEINLISKKTYQATINFTYRILKKILDDYPCLNNVKKSKLSDYSFRAKHKKILDELNQSVITTLDCLTKDRPFTMKEGSIILELTCLEKKFYASDSPLYQLASQLGATFVPSMQLLDPLRGKEIMDHGVKQQGGLCLGHVLTWSNEIKKKGYSRLLFRTDVATINKQNSLSRYRDRVTALNIYSRDSIPLYMNIFFKDISCARIYKINIYSNDNAVKHAMGVRIIPLSKQVEFVDSNVVSPILFDNIEKFKIWFSYLVREEYFKRGGVHLRLSMLDLQPEDAKPSITFAIKTK